MPRWYVLDDSLLRDFYWDRSVRPWRVPVVVALWIWIFVLRRLFSLFRVRGGFPFVMLSLVTLTPAAGYPSSALLSCCLLFAVHLSSFLTGTCFTSSGFVLHSHVTPKYFHLTS